jgi:hypothetical protein
MLIDDVIIKIKAGDGGRGGVGFNKSKGNKAHWIQWRTWSNFILKESPAWTP